MKRYRVALLVVLVAALCVSLAEAAPRPWTGRVVAVTDGDTIKVMRKGKAQKVRLFGVDCPESKQDFGTRAKWFTSGLCYGQEVRVEPVTKDRYKRYVAWVILPDGRKLNEELVRGGMAWVYRQYTDEAALIALEAEAKEAKRGLWSHPNPVPPWEWRKAKRKQKRPF